LTDLESAQTLKLAAAPERAPTALRCWKGLLKGVMKTALKTPETYRYGRK
jgi:hypothetical protein